MNLHPLTVNRLKAIKQADVVLLMFTLGHLFSLEQKKANYEYYEPITTHASSLSPAIHSIVAGELGKEEQMYEYFQDSALMDIYDIKHNSANGVHSASQGATWMTIVNGFAGMRDYPEKLVFNPKLPNIWKSLKFQISVKGNKIRIQMNKEKIIFSLMDGKGIRFDVYNKGYELSNHNSEICVLYRVLSASLHDMNFRGR